MKLLLGLILVTVGFTLASIHLNQNITSYWDFVAFSVVLFGTIAVMMINRPQMKLKSLWSHLRNGIGGKSISKKSFIEDCVSISVKGKDIPKNKTISHQLLRDGSELIGLGFTSEHIESILSQRFHNYARSVTGVSNWLRKNAKYPPAFGLAGTVLGLIHLMRGISDGINTQETGIRMAIALVATFYGLVISNIFLNPTGELLNEQLKLDEEKSEIAIHTIKLMMQKSSAIVIQEELNSYMDEEEKINVLSSVEILEAA